MSNSSTSNTYLHSGGPPFVGILFCPECLQYVVPKRRHRYKYSFLRPLQLFVQTTCPEKVHLLQQDRTKCRLRNIVPDVVTDPALPRSDCHPCPQCDRQDASRRAESEMRLMYYVCRNSKLNWQL
ncbi:hypothetical protein Zmor_015208 [Zophobas morio]|uniref:DNA-directed RNA polymerase subunit n=1 Tax=Zophobas morio TaxID=2755281 RepID=A0AA38MHC8_9CUCU|nr:hypothetical protein Zmor_015208 [Zophobas morio]